MGSVSAFKIQQWPKGVSGNPAGRPKGARNKLNETFLHELAEDFEIHGRKAIEDARADDPMGYVRVVAALCPRDAALASRLGEMTDEQLLAALDALGRFVAGAGSAGEDQAGDGDAGEAAPVTDVPAISEAV